LRTITKNMSGLKKIEEALEKAPSIKSMFQLDVVQERFIANYEATTRKKDGPARFQSEVFAYLEIMSDKPDLMKANRFSHFAAIIKAGTTGLSFRDNKLYVMPGPNNTVKIQSSPAGKREMMENMQEIKQFPEAQLVMKGDHFVVDKLNGTILEHKSTKDSSTNTGSLDDIVASYQRVYWKDGTIKDVILYKADLLKAKAKSKAQSEAGFWAQWPGEACKKVATNRAFRLYHKYPDNLVTFGKDDDKADDTVQETYTEAEVVQPQAVVVEPEPVPDEPPAEEAKVVKPSKGKSNMAALMEED
jgi:recombinational DNA repair protein RecT